MSLHLGPAEATEGQLVSSLPVALRMAARQHTRTSLVFRSPASMAEVPVAEVCRRASSVAAGLQALGVGRGEVVAVQLPHRVEAAVAYAAVLLRGAVLLPLAPSWGAEDVHSVLRHSGAAAFITSAWRSHDVLRARNAGISRLRHVVAVTGTWPTAGLPADGVDWEMLERYRPMSPGGTARPDDSSLLLYSPVTGVTPPRAVLHTHASLLAELTSMPPLPGSTPGHVHLAPPTSSGLTSATTVLRALVSGLPTVFLERWGAQAALDLVHRHGVTSAALSAHHLEGLLDAASHDERGLGRLVECFVLQGMTPSVVEAAERTGLLAYGGYSRLEHPTVAAGSARDPLALRAAGAVRPLPGSEVRIADAGGRELPAGHEGHIHSRGPELFTAYRGQALPSRTDAGWFATGDRGVLDAEGFLHVSGAAAPKRAETAAGCMVA